MFLQDSQLQVWCRFSVNVALNTIEMFYSNAAIYFYGYGGYLWSSNCDPWFPLTLAGQNSDAQIGCGVQSGARVEFSPISNFNGEDLTKIGY